jgi:Transposase DDE domain
MISLHPRTGSDFVSIATGGFLAAVQDLLKLAAPEKILGCALQRAARCQDRATLGLWQLMAGLVYHVSAGAGTLSAHIKELFKLSPSDSALSQRRLTLGAMPFIQIMNAVLRPLADVAAHPSSFFKGLRLVAIDGSQFSLSNTPANVRGRRKTKSRRSLAAFPKVGLSVVLEVGLHAPLAAALGLEGESELALAARLWGSISASSLLLADRLYGTAKTLWHLWDHLKSQGSHFLCRVKGDLKFKKSKFLPDGSVQGEVSWQDAKNKDLHGTLKIREIRGKVRRHGQSQWSEVRLWTSLMDEKAYPAAELFALYAQRWEQELFFKILKRDLRPGPLLQSQTVPTAGQELCAVVVAAALLARQRAAVAEASGVPLQRVSFSKVMRLVQAQWLVLQASGSLLAPEQAAAVAQAVFALMMEQAVLPPRRTRTCPRAVRQPVSAWPRLLANESLNGPIEYETITINELTLSPTRAPRTKKPAISGIS